MNKLNRIDWRIITGKIKGTLTRAEEREFQTWYNTHPRHRAYFQRVASTWNKEEEDSVQVDVETLIQEFDRHVKSRRNRAMPVYRRVMSVAAVVISLIVLSAVLFFTTRQAPTGEMLTALKLEPGQSKARLTLTNGEIVMLDQADGNPGMIDEDGITIRREKGRVAYFEGDSAHVDKQGHHVMEIPRGGEFMLLLSDGTKVWLNSQTRLSYPMRFTGENREVELEGEAYFQVTPDTCHPFIVKTGNNRVKVYGTSFNVNAYQEDGSMITTLEEGHVGVFVHGKEYKLLPGEQAFVQVDTREVQVRKVNANIYCSWRNGTFIFEEESLETILTRLSRWYNTNVFYEHEELKHLHFTGDLGRYEDFNEVLSLIELTTRVRFEVKERTITVKSK